MNFKTLILQRLIKLATGLDYEALIAAVKAKDFSAVGPMVEKLAVLLGFDAYGKEAKELLSAIATGDSKVIAKNVADFGYLYAGYTPLPDVSMLSAFDSAEAFDPDADQAKVLAFLKSPDATDSPSWLDALIALIRLWLDWSSKQVTPAIVTA